MIAHDTVPGVEQAVTFSYPPYPGRRFPRLRAVRSVALLSVVSWLFLTALVLAAEPGSFRFAWLSDTHVGSNTGEEDLRAAVKDINGMSDLSFVVHSGDVTEYGSREQLRLAKALLDELRIPCYVVPGNHDTKWSESGGTDFPRLWKADRFVFEHGGYRFIGLHEGPLMKMGDGHWARQDVRWLENVLRELPDKNQPVIFITHYPLDDSIDNWYVVLDLLKRHNVQAVLCGHGHADHNLLFEGVPGVMGRSNLRASNPAGGFNVVEINNGAMSVAEHVNGGQTLAAWHSVPLQQHDYSSDTNRYPRPDFSVNLRYPNVKQRWKFNTGYTIAAAPALWKDLAIVGDASGTVYALGIASGKLKWKFNTGNAILSTAALGEDIVVMPSTDGSVYGLAAASGRQLWRRDTGRPFVASPAIASGQVYLGSSEGKFRALELASGKPVWEFGGVSGFVETRPLVHEGRVIFGAWDEHLYALRADTGKLLWKWKGPKPGALYSPAACWPVEAKGKIFVVAPDRKMTAIDARTGAQLWRTGDYVVRESIGMAEDQSRFYVRAMNDFFYAFSTAASQPEKVWGTDAHFGYDINSAMLVERQGAVFYGTKNGLVLALQAKTGAIRWQHKLGVGVVNTLAPLSSSRVLAADCDGQIVLLEAGERAGK